MDNMKFDKSLDDTVDHACEIGGQGHYLKDLLIKVREENKALRKLVEGADAGRKGMVYDLENHERKVNDTLAALDRATNTIADLQRKNMALIKSNEELTKLLKKSEGKRNKKRGR